MQKAWVQKIEIFIMEGIRGLDYPSKEAKGKTL